VIVVGHVLDGFASTVNAVIMRDLPVQFDIVLDVSHR
jgi:hypothetical protein